MESIAMESKPKVWVPPPTIPTLGHSVVYFYPTIKPEVVLVPILSCIFGLPVFVLLLILALRYRRKCIANNARTKISMKKGNRCKRDFGKNNSNLNSTHNNGKLGTFQEHGIKSTVVRFQGVPCDENTGGETSSSNTSGEVPALMRLAMKQQDEEEEESDRQPSEDEESGGDMWALDSALNSENNSEQSSSAGSPQHKKSLWHKALSRIQKSKKASNENGIGGENENTEIEEKPITSFRQLVLEATRKQKELDKSSEVNENTVVSEGETKTDSDNNMVNTLVKVEVEPENTPPKTFRQLILEYAKKQRELEKELENNTNEINETKQEDIKVKTDNSSIRSETFSCHSEKGAINETSFITTDTCKLPVSREFLSVGDKSGSTNRESDNVSILSSGHCECCSLKNNSIIINKEISTELCSNDSYKGDLTLSTSSFINENEQSLNYCSIDDFCDSSNISPFSDTVVYTKWPNTNYGCNIDRKQIKGEKQSFSRRSSIGEHMWNYNRKRRDTSVDKFKNENILMSGRPVRYSVTEFNLDKLFEEGTRSLAESEMSKKGYHRTTFDVTSNEIKGVEKEYRTFRTKNHIIDHTTKSKQNSSRITVDKRSSNSFEMPQCNELEAITVIPSTSREQIVSVKIEDKSNLQK
ncbi:unnamed protein product, partial [Meganyctiphanes norvegica]